MKLGIVYTSTTPELIECVNEEIRKNLGDAPEILNYSGSVYSGRSKRAWICNSRRSSPSCRNVYAGCF